MEHSTPKCVDPQNFWLGRLATTTAGYYLNKGVSIVMRLPQNRWLINVNQRKLGSNLPSYAGLLPWWLLPDEGWCETFTIGLSFGVAKLWQVYRCIYVLTGDLELWKWASWKWRFPSKCGRNSYEKFRDDPFFDENEDPLAESRTLLVDSASGKKLKSTELQSRARNPTSPWSWS